MSKRAKKRDIFSNIFNNQARNLLAEFSPTINWEETLQSGRRSSGGYPPDYRRRNGPTSTFLVTRWISGGWKFSTLKVPEVGLKLVMLRREWVTMESRLRSFSLCTSESGFLSFSSSPIGDINWCLQKIQDVYESTSDPLIAELRLIL